MPVEGDTNVGVAKTTSLLIQWDRTFSWQLLGKAVADARLLCALMRSLNSSVTASMPLERAEIILPRDVISAVAN